MRPTHHDSFSFRVLVAGGGLAGLETLTALHALAAPRVELTLVAPENDFVFRPIATKEPFAVERLRQIPLREAAREANAAYVGAKIESVDTHNRLVHISGARRIEYDGLVLAIGSDATPAVANALTWDDRFDADVLGGLLQDFELGYSRRLAVVIPPGAVWPLRAYELALFITRQAQDMSADIETTLSRRKLHHYRYWARAYSSSYRKNFSGQGYPSCLPTMPTSKLAIPPRSSWKRLGGAWRSTT